MVWSNEQIEWWRGRQKAYLEDKVAVEHDKLIDLQRIQAQQEMLKSLNSFLDMKISLKEFNATFQQRTNDMWGAFHLRGMSGGLFFNKLVKHVPDEETFAHLLRLMIHLPEDVREAQQRLHAFVRFLEGLITSQQVQRAQLQPARVPFFLSTWWHVQDPERWPIFYVDVRQAFLRGETPPKESRDPVEAYFAFRTRFLALAQALGVSSWELEHLASWYARGNAKADDVEKAQAAADSRSDNHRVSPQKQTCVLASRTMAKGRNGTAGGNEENNAHMKEQMVSCRTHLQWLLAKLGQKVGCRVWIAAGDHGKICQHERLGSLSLPSLPALADTALQQIIRQIDVLWLLDNDIVAAYEIEQAHTDVSTSLLRLYDLGALFPERQVHLCVVAPQDRFEKVQFELSRPTFREQGQRKPCALISEELLLQQEAHILRWASSPAVIEELIGSVSNGNRR